MLTNVILNINVQMPRIYFWTVEKKKNLSVGQKQPSKFSTLPRPRSGKIHITSRHHLWQIWGTTECFPFQTGMEEASCEKAALVSTYQENTDGFNVIQGPAARIRPARLPEDYFSCEFL